MITPDQVRHVARLARLRLEDQEVDAMTSQLGAILEYFAQLDQADTTGVPPAAHPLPLRNVTRADEIKPGLPLDEALANAPQRDGDFFRVPKIV